MMKSPWILSLALLALPAAAQTSCPPPPWNQAKLQLLKGQQWKMDDSDARQNLALALLPCLANANPVLRDGLAFEALSSWMRGKQLESATLAKILHQLRPQLMLQAPDTDGFARPFAALVLSEVARADRINSFLSPQERNELLNTADAYLRGISDYRGFSEGFGWRHGVAHGADLLMQLALNPAFDAAQLEQIARAVQTQIAPASGHAYVFGESERLARPILLAARRGLVSPAWWQAWVLQVAAPQAKDWDSAMATSAGLARLHNTKAFLLSLYLNLQESNNENMKAALREPVREALLKLP